MIAMAWEFDVKKGKQAEFEQFYGAAGEWTAIARRSRSYLGTSFLHDFAQPTRYLLVEYWSEMVVYERHQEDFRRDIERLERRRDLLLASCQPLGIFSALDVPDRSGPTWSRRSK